MRAQRSSRDNLVVGAPYKGREPIRGRFGTYTDSGKVTTDQVFDKGSLSHTSRYREIVLRDVSVRVLIVLVESSRPSAKKALTYIAPTVIPEEGLQNRPVIRAENESVHIGKIVPTAEFFSCIVLQAP